MKKSPWEIPATLVVLALAGVCLCLAMAAGALSLFGETITASIRDLFDRSSEPSLARILRRNQEASFRLSDDCQFPYTRGQAVSSDPELGQDGGQAEDLSSEQVVAAVQPVFRQITFVAADGELSLQSGIPVEVSFPGNEAVSVKFVEETAREDSVTSRSLQAVVQGNTIQGRYDETENISSMDSGQGYEKSTAISADFNCPIVWVETP